MELDLRLRLRARRDRHSSMTDWLDDEIRSANERAEAQTQKLARRDSDAQLIERGRRKFWDALIQSLVDSIDRFNNRPGGLHEGVEISDKEDKRYIWIRTPGYPPSF
jgi:hypothetical protein